MRTGVPPSGKQLAVMSDVARSDFSHFKDDEIEAIHGYLVAYVSLVAAMGGTRTLAVFYLGIGSKP